MKRFYKSIKSSNLNIAPKTCQNCRVIRIFLLSVLFILLLGVINRTLNKKIRITLQFWQVLGAIFKFEDLIDL